MQEEIFYSTHTLVVKNNIFMNNTILNSKIDKQTHNHKTKKTSNIDNKTSIFLTQGVQNVEFVAGAALYSSLPKFSLPEIAFLGRSNVGKSTLINSVLGRKSIAKVSQTPGRTQQINLFRIEKNFILADLPGYGYAKISKKTVSTIQQLIYSYLRERSRLIRLMLLIDARRGITEMDEEIIEFLAQIPISFQIIFTKIDKVKQSEKDILANDWAKKASIYSCCCPSYLEVSSINKVGMDMLRKTITELTYSNK